MKGPGPGLLVSFEGIEGSGKTTQIDLVAGRLRSDGRDILVVREPGGTDLGEALRDLLLRAGGGPIEPRAELFLYLAARAQLVSQVVRPALSAGRIVLADRFGDASVAYQGGGRGLGPERVGRLVKVATGGLAPRRTYLLDLPVERSLARVRARGALDRLEGETLAFHRRVRAAYRAVAAAEPERVRMLRAAAPPEEIADRIWRDLCRLLPCHPAEDRPA